MQPTLNPDLRCSDYVFLNRWAVRRQNVRRGDIVCVISPKEPSQKLIKRVIGLAGDIVGTHGYKISALQVWIQYVEVIIGCRRDTAGWKGTTLDVLWTPIPSGRYLWVW
ncbi:PREDICTED: mitochondrial inner membrane protease subunit 2 [Vollenhovia emeryi]|uniref:mitochondrial inner membrane protease subunit 2 n=1 Tax=Vollenhovia emeryi TaxID=411798 RepID=UPI0005F3A13A|nr:PREDICTED: mitochondrial inner membrane protease subunit 2 [Vollenhovia emeryi]